MNGFVRGGIAVAILSLAAFIYAQTTTSDDLIIAAAPNAQAIADNIDTTLIDNFSNNFSVISDDDDKKLVKTTASVRAAGAGASKGAFSATAYCFSGRTAMGHGVRRGLIAADPRVLKMGSRVYINAGQWSGTYLVSDTGGAIKGKRIDIWVPGCSEARRFGRRSVQVYAAQ
ncbi:MAG TPA: 3D domain-containing protein [Pyrinomonadaceae bacterium]|jgi:3D (Asp-Asp-Asp) domain-containing protein|nr:3D domain-containing protein [Pyrinomonadaceae bacterium]